VPLWRGRRLRKRWRYVSVFSEELMLCAARVEVGPVAQTFWAILDRARGELHERTRLRAPGRRGEVWTEGGAIGGDRDGALTRIEAPGVSAALRFGAGGWVESVCPTSEGRYVWTRKRTSSIECEVRFGERRISVVAPGIEDETAGYHPRRTTWSWSAGVGETREGRAIAWNLVSGINDPPRRSERAIWLDGEPVEPGPVSFDGLEAIHFEDGSRLEFSAEAERSREENLLLVRSSYRQPFGSFSGVLAGGIELRRGLGVMEHHDAVW
jgi:hypothetical protein